MAGVIFIPSGCGVIGRDGLYLHIADGGIRIAVFQDLPFSQLLLAVLVGDDFRIAFLDSLYRFRVQMIAMLVGDQDDIGFRESRIIGVFGDRIYLYRMIVVRKHQAAVLDERDGQFFSALGLERIRGEVTSGG